MLEPISKGIGLGLIIAIMIGPVFFYLLNTSIKKGFLPASLCALGVTLSDLFFISVAYFGSSFLLYMDKHEEITGFTGGAVIIIFGLLLIFREARVNAESLKIEENKSSPVFYIIKGFMLNSINPSVLLFWIVIASTIPVKEQFSPAYTLIFYAFTLITVLTTDLMKAYLAHRLKKIITAGTLIALNRISGSALILYGGSMIVRVILNS